MAVYVFRTLDFAKALRSESNCQGNAVTKKWSHPLPNLAKIHLILVGGLLYSPVPSVFLTETASAQKI